MIASVCTAALLDYLVRVVGAPIVIILPLFGPVILLMTVVGDNSAFFNPTGNIILFIVFSFCTIPLFVPYMLENTSSNKYLLFLGVIIWEFIGVVSFIWWGLAG